MEKNLFGRELNAFNTFSSLLDRFSPVEDVLDRWRWKGSSDGKYSTKNMYDILKDHNLNDRNRDINGVEVLS